MDRLRRYLPPSPIHGADVGTMGLVTQHESANGRCLLCGRKSENVTTAELGNWIVQDGGILVCSGCSSDSDKAAAGPEALQTGTSREVAGQHRPASEMNPGHTSPGR